MLLAQLLLLPLLCQDPAAAAPELPAGPPIPDQFVLADGRTLPVRDLREWAAWDRDDLAVVDPSAHAELDRLFAAAVVRRAAGVGLGPATSPVLASLARRAGLPGPGGAAGGAWNGPAAPPPGGVGYGVIYNDSAFRWNDSTASYQSMIVPRKPGGDVTTWLYSTTTNRSELGVEAFVSYFAQDDFHFKVFDWSRYPASPWQTDVPYASLGEYVSSMENDDGTWRQELFVVNETFNQPGNRNAWTNRVLLENRVQGTMDVVYQWSYTTTNPNQNTWESGDGIGWWGPIFETFQDHDGSNTPIGWNDSWLVQDGTVQDFTTSTTWIRNDDPDLVPPVFLTRNRAWAVGSTLGEPAVTNLEAESGKHGVGQPTAGGWLAGPAHGVGKMLKGPAFRSVPGGRKNAEFRFKVDNLVGPGGDLVLFGVLDLTSRTLVQVEALRLSDFPQAGAWRPFRFDFTAAAGHHYILGAKSLGLHDVTLDRVTLVQN